MNDSELMALILNGREERNLEYKRSIGWNNAESKAKIARTILGMSNIRDGGAIVIGVTQSGESFTPDGISLADLESFTQDTVSEWVNLYADPFVELTVSRTWQENIPFVVIQVAEFPEIPVVCKKKWTFGASQTRGNLHAFTAKE